ncbi:hypothetical protein BSL82_15935 [Tardibacter chloracetimidivorans]|uniref:DUF4154 domain-containing protein n=1 Tax=Tardibacter chloracetimidivorans TaxID=1921510 RepID=A0A1L3ZY87_9SPHN|nr:YfiR family protein [Tardibacter chloracetimidivorans]API60594.1 hypothetical protein BSL82_15935 [Tardibacter chloracetimidivorans]
MAYLGSARAFRRMRRAAAVAIFIAGTVPTSAAAGADPPLEQAVKASFLFKFVPFVDWPANAFASATAPFQICLSGQDPFGPVLDEVVRGQRVHGRTIIVRRLKDANPAGCNLLFAGETSDLDPDILSGKAAKPILTVTDRSKSVAGGMIDFVMQGGRVRFRIDERAARASGLRISSKLLGLAVAVEDR